MKGCCLSSSTRIVKNFVQGRPYGGRLLEWARAICGLGELSSDEFQYVEGFEARRGEAFLEQMRRQVQRDFYYMSEWLARVNAVEVSKTSLINEPECQEDLIRFIEDMLRIHLAASESNDRLDEIFWHVKVSINNVTEDDMKSRRGLPDFGPWMVSTHVVVSELHDEGPTAVSPVLDDISGEQCSRVALSEHEIQCGDLVVIKGSSYATLSDATPLATDGCVDCQMKFFITVDRIDAHEKAQLVSMLGANATDDDDKDDDSEEVNQLPVTLFSGFRNAGKTSVVTHSLKNLMGLRVAVLVNNMASINIGASLQDGISFHAIHEDLVESIRNLALERRFDYLLVEHTGISEPLHVATAFEACDDMEVPILEKMARLDTLVTVIDSVNFLNDCHSEERVVDRKDLEAEDADERFIVDLLIEQTELANVLILNKTDLVTSEQLKELEVFLKQLNPGARLIKAKFGVVRPELVMNTNSFGLDSPSMLPGWAMEMQRRGRNHNPETNEFGISSFSYSAVRPFHPERLDRMLKDGAPLIGVLRSKGCVWSASEHRMSLQWCQAGISMDLKPWVRWLQEPRCKWPSWAEEYKKCTYGTRRQEIVFIGKNMDESEIRQALDEVLLTDEEFTLGPSRWSDWLKLAETHGHSHMDHCVPCVDGNHGLIWC